jgi:hypothetical protein
MGGEAIFVRHLRRRLWLEFLPAYAPELNPVEYLWTHRKHRELPSLCPDCYGELSDHARRALRRMRGRPMLVCAFWQQPELFFPLKLYYLILNRQSYYELCYEARALRVYDLCRPGVHIASIAYVWVAGSPGSRRFED